MKRLVLASLGLVALLGIALVGYALLFRPSASPVGSPLTSWSSHYASLPVALSVDLTNIAGDKNIQAVNADCAQLQADVQSATRVPPLPIAALNAPWQGVLHSANGIVLRCEEVVTHPGDTSVFTSMRTSALSELVTLRGLMNDLGGS